MNGRVSEEVNLSVLIIASWSGRHNLGGQCPGSTLWINIFDATPSDRAGSLESSWNTVSPHLRKGFAI